MSHTIEAIYEHGAFKPLGPVELPDGTRARVEIEPTAAEVEEMIRQQALAEGADPAETGRILENLRLLWRSYDTLTEEQKALVESARLDQEHFFDRESE
jgi:predicted DNA-binding antitoxin AbrB/MazE fold protein